ARDADPRHAGSDISRAGRRYDRRSVAIDGQRNPPAVGRGRHRLFRPDRDRLHDGRDRPPAADERLPRSSNLCPQRRSVQPDPWTGVGSMASERVRLTGAGKLVVWGGASACYLFALPFWLPPLLACVDGAGLFVRAGLCVLVLAPAGFLMGFGFPTGMRLVSAINTGPTPWFWGINGASGVLAASVAVVTSIAFSIDTTLRIGAA